MKSVSNILFLFFSACFLFSCSNKTSEKEKNTASANHLFKIVNASESGVNFENNLTESDSLNILDYLYFYNGGGAAMGDINNDGLPDLFFSANLQKNKLFLNKGNMQFEDISETAKIQGNSSWNTGAVMADANGDGWLDIYVIAVVGINGFTGHNELYINNKDNTFSEKSLEYGLDFQSYGTTASFFDYDLDGDLDVYILNHAVHTEESFGRAKIREERDEKTGDKLLRNDGNKFVDVSEEAGIYGGINGYGLGLAVSDFNMDGYPDMYVGNDFHEDDYYYLNNGDGTFTESLKKYFGHTSRFSMGNDVADINHDGLPDIISLDMLPEDEVVLKSSEGDDTYQTLKMRTQQFGYHYQFTRNMLFLNQPNAAFEETAIISGIEATDWSWSALFADYDQDGNQDLFISNGIPKRPNDSDYLRFTSDAYVKKGLSETRAIDKQALKMMPSGKINNFVFQGDGKGSFIDKSKNWINENPSISGATVVGDLDNDGDLDVVASNINSPVSVYENLTNKNANYLKLKFQFIEKNRFGIGTKAFLYSKGSMQYKELFPSRGWQASSEPMLHFGLGNDNKIDSVKIVWPNSTYQVLKNVEANQFLNISPDNPQPYTYKKENHKKIFRKAENKLGLSYRHKEDNHTDFDYQKLIPYEVSDRGPAVAIGDLDGDGKEDIFFGGAKNQKASVNLQKENTFTLSAYSTIENDSVFEDVSAVIADFNDDSQNDLFIASGGNTISPSRKILANRLYSNLSEKTTFEDDLNNTSVVKPFDFDGDGDLDLFVGNHTSILDFGKISTSYMLKNDNGVFTKETPTDFENLGMVTDAVWDDFDNDGQTDLIVIGEWMQPTFFKNENGNLVKTEILNEKLKGLWRSIIPFDIDHDGDTDYILGNWGLNSKFEASQEHPMRMYYSDFDANGTTETVIATYKNGKYYPLLGLNDLASQMVLLRKKFVNYKDFAGKTIEEVMGKELLDKATLFETHTLASGYLKNENGRFTFHKFPNILQLAPITAFVKYDFNGDGKESVLAGGNYFGVIPFHGRFDSFPGALIASEENITNTNVWGLNMSQKSVRHLKIINFKEKPYLLIVYNNDEIETYEIDR